MDEKEIDRYTDHYFLNARTAVQHAGVNVRVLYQVFQRESALLCGMKYVLQLLSTLGSEIEVHGLQDGARISRNEPVMHIAGPVDKLLPLETIYLGLFARMTRVATNVKEAVDAAGGKPVLFFPARFDIPEAQKYDGHAARIGGAAGASTQAEADAYHATAIGTMPHALIAAFKGNTVAAAVALAEALPNEPLWVLVDFENDSARTAVEVFRPYTNADCDSTESGWIPARNSWTRASNTSVRPRMAFSLNSRLRFDAGWMRLAGTR